MTKRFAGLFAAVLMVAAGFAPTPTQAQENATEETGTSADTNAGASADSTKDETFMDKLEDAFKETTTPTDEEVDPIGTAEDAGRDLY